MRAIRLAGRSPADSARAVTSWKPSQSRQISMPTLAGIDALDIRCTFAGHASADAEIPRKMSEMWRICHTYCFNREVAVYQNMTIFVK